MARKPRVDVEGGLYQLIVRGNNRRRIFDAPDDYQKFLSLLEIQKSRLPYFLYAYCLMTNHVHLLMERQAASISRIMHRVLTGYSQYYNRKYGRSGHLLHGATQSDSLPDRSSGEPRRGQACDSAIPRASHTLPHASPSFSPSSLKHRGKVDALTDVGSSL